MMKCLAAFVACSLVAVSSAPVFGQPAPQRPPQPRVQLPIDPLGLNNRGGSSTPTCDMNIFVDLARENLKQFLGACAAKLAADSQAALDDATAKGDKVAIACLTPGTDILKAAAPTGDQEAGVILMFQKFRDFILAGGKENCKAWLNTTVAGALTP